MPARLKQHNPGVLELSKALGLAYKCAALRSHESADILTSVHGDRLRITYDPAGHRMTALCASTHTLDQWLSNLRRSKECARAFMRQTPGQVHLDFSLRVAELWPYLHNAWKANGCPTIDLAGHSRGGAMVTLLASLMAVNAAPGYLGDIITFGCPRVGDARFADWYDDRLGQKTMRLVHCADGVPYLPTRLLGYSNMGSLVYIDRTGRISMDYESPPIMDRVIAMARHIGTRGARMVKDHNLTQYIAALNNAITQQP